MLNLGCEDEVTEFKKSTKLLNEASDSIASILNKHRSGVLFFGVTREGDVIGQNVSEKTLRDIGQSIGYRIEPSITPTITKLNAEGRDYIRVDFQGADVPYSSAGKYRIRVADEDRLMSRAELVLMLTVESQKAKPWDRRVSQRTLADIDVAQLEQYLKRGREAGRISFFYSSPEDALKRLELMSDESLTNAADILFCHSENTMLKMAIFATDARINILDMKQERGTLFDLVAKAEDYLLRNIKWRFELTGALQREEIPEIPREAIREALINAFCHRDYQSALAVQVDIFGDKIELFSPGRFPLGTSPSDCLSGSKPFSKSPNELIALTLFRSKDIESYGTGIPRIVKFCEEADVGIEYEEVPQGVILRFRRPRWLDAEKASKTADKLPITADKLPITADLSPRDLEFLRKATRASVAYELITEKGSVKSSEVAEALGVKQRAALNVLRGLMDAGIVESFGANRNRRYRLAQKYFD